VSPDQGGARKTDINTGGGDKGGVNFWFDFFTTCLDSFNRNGVGQGGGHYKGAKKKEKKRERDEAKQRKPENEWEGIMKTMGVEEGKRGKAYEHFFRRGKRAEQIRESKEVSCPSKEK